MSSHTSHMTMETVYGQMQALRLGDRDEHRALESDTTGLNVKENLYLYNAMKAELLDALDPVWRSYWFSITTSRIPQPLTILSGGL